MKNPWKFQTGVHLNMEQVTNMCELVAYEILKESKDFHLRSMDEQGEMCVKACEYMKEDPHFASKLRKFVEWYNENI